MMKIACKLLGSLVILLLFPGLAASDDLTGSDRWLCSAIEATVCDVDGDCNLGAPWLWNIPQFIEVDLTKKKIATTKASSENRETPILTLERSEGLVFMQGIENGRAFSFVVEEKTGALSAAVARMGITVSVFGECTTRNAER
jgi:hypothetical protein